MKLLKLYSALKINVIKINEKFTNTNIQFYLFKKYIYIKMIFSLMFFKYCTD